MKYPNPAYPSQTTPHQPTMTPQKHRGGENAASTLGVAPRTPISGMGMTQMGHRSPPPTAERKPHAQMTLPGYRKYNMNIKNASTNGSLSFRSCHSARSNATMLSSMASNFGSAESGKSISLSGSRSARANSGNLSARAVSGSGISCEDYARRKSDTNNISGIPQGGGTSNTMATSAGQSLLSSRSKSGTSSTGSLSQMKLAMLETSAKKSSFERGGGLPPKPYKTPPAAQHKLDYSHHDYSYNAAAAPPASRGPDASRTPHEHRSTTYAMKHRSRLFPSGQQTSNATTTQSGSHYDTRLQQRQQAQQQMPPPKTPTQMSNHTSHHKVQSLASTKPYKSSQFLVPQTDTKTNPYNTQKVPVPAEKPKPKKKSGRDEIQHFEWNRGDYLGDAKRYQMHKVLGDGTFGRVIECQDTTSRQMVAVKVVRDVQRYTEAAEIEAEILREIARARHPNPRCVMLKDSFMHNNSNFCMVFEPLGKNLYEFLKGNGYKGFHICDLQTIARELMSALVFLHDIRLTHTDLKPENLLFISNETYTAPFSRSRSAHPSCVKRPTNAAIKLIDFGGATFDRDHHSSVINTRQYRCPEVILNSDWNESSDLWSVGCILMELYTGEMLFPTHDNIEHLAMIETVIQQEFPRSMTMRAGKNARKLIRNDGRIDWPEGASGQQSLRLVQRCKPPHKLVLQEHIELANLVKALLKINPAERMPARDAVKHPFFQIDYS